LERTLFLGHFLFGLRTKCFILEAAASYIPELSWRNWERTSFSCTSAKPWKRKKLADNFGAWKMTDEEEKAMFEELTRGWQTARKNLEMKHEN
jgi:hypothetical protein